VSIDSPYTLLTAVTLAVIAPGVLAFAWDRGRIAGRIALVTLVVLTASGAAALQVNHLTATYPSWSALFGGPADDDPAGDAPAGGSILDAGAGKGRLATYQVPGPVSGMNMPLKVYLPAAYFTPEGQRLRFPVIQALHGYPGTPDYWMRRLDAVRHLDREITAGRMAPTVVLFPYQTPDGLVDTECTDLAGGPRAETYLTTDVRRWASENLRVRTDRTGWGLIGYSAGGFCATNLAVRHPDLYTAAASLSGGAEPGIKIGDGSEKTTNNIGWQLAHRPPPPVSLYLAWAADDGWARKAGQRVRRLAKSPTVVDTATVPRGGHTSSVWKQMEAPAFDWLSAHLAGPAPAGPPASTGPPAWPT